MMKEMVNLVLVQKALMVWLMTQKIVEPIIIIGVLTLNY